MGDRVSISFATYDDNRTVIDESIAVFDHWAVMRLDTILKDMNRGGT